MISVSTELRMEHSAATVKVETVQNLHSPGAIDHEIVKMYFSNLIWQVDSPIQELAFP